MHLLWERLYMDLDLFYMLLNGFIPAEALVGLWAISYACRWQWTPTPVFTKTAGWKKRFGVSGLVGVGGLPVLFDMLISPTRLLRFKRRPTELTKLQDEVKRKWTILNAARKSSNKELHEKTALLDKSMNNMAVEWCRRFDNNVVLTRALEKAQHEQAKKVVDTRERGVTLAGLHAGMETCQRRMLRIDEKLNTLDSMVTAMALVDPRDAIASVEKRLTERHDQHREMMVAWRDDLCMKNVEIITGERQQRDLLRGEVFTAQGEHERVLDARQHQVEKQLTEMKVLFNQLQTAVSCANAHDHSQLQALRESVSREIENKLGGVHTLYRGMQTDRDEAIAAVEKRFTKLDDMVEFLVGESESLIRSTQELWGEAREIAEEALKNHIGDMGNYIQEKVSETVEALKPDVVRAARDESVGDAVIAAQRAMQEHVENAEIHEDNIQSLFERAKVVEEKLEKLDSVLRAFSMAGMPLLVSSTPSVVGGQGGSGCGGTLDRWQQRPSIGGEAGASTGGLALPQHGVTCTGYVVTSPHGS